MTHLCTRLQCIHLQYLLCACLVPMLFLYIKQLLALRQNHAHVSTTAHAHKRAHACAWMHTHIPIFFFTWIFVHVCVHVVCKCGSVPACLLFAWCFLFRIGCVSLKGKDTLIILLLHCWDKDVYICIVKIKTLSTWVPRTKKTKRVAACTLVRVFPITYVVQERLLPMDYKFVHKLAKKITA